jgi:hypothetical protein
MHGIELAGGHHPNDLGRYRELVGMVGSQPPMNLIQNPRLLSLLNVRYLLWPEAQFGAVAQLGPAFQGLTAVNEVKLNDGRTYSALYELPTLPRARLVGSARVVPEDQAVATMMDASFDPNREVVLSEAPPVALDGSGGGGSVTWTSRGPNRGVMQVTSDGPALLVVSDNWFPAWKATVNGNEAPVLRAYHTLRAIPVEAGTSTVDMFYDTAGLSRGLWTSFVSLLLAIAALVHGFVSGRKARAEGPDFAE